jgi:hypothetical protein
MEIQDVKTVWVAWTNTDCTEGRGQQIPKAVCESEAAAIRIGKKGYVQGSDCPVEKGIAVKIQNQWLAAVRIYAATKEDVANQNSIDKKNALLEKAKKAGFTEEEIKLMGSSIK